MSEVLHPRCSRRAVLELWNHELISELEMTYFPRSPKPANVIQVIDISLRRQSYLLSSFSSFLSWAGTGSYIGIE